MAGERGEAPSTATNSSTADSVKVESGNPRPDNSKSNNPQENPNNKTNNTQAKKENKGSDNSEGSTKEKDDGSGINAKQESDRIWKKTAEFIKEKVSYGNKIQRGEKRDPNEEQELRKKEKILKEEIETAKIGPIGSFLRSIFKLPELDVDTGNFFVPDKEQEQIFERLVVSENTPPEAVIESVKNKELREVKGGAPGVYDPLVEQILQQALGERIKKLDTANVNEAIQSGQFDSPELKEVQDLWNNLTQINKLNPARDESEGIISPYDENRAVRRVISLTDTFSSIYEAALRQSLNEYKRSHPGANLQDQATYNDATRLAFNAGKEAVKELVEEQLGYIEEDDASVRSEDVSALQQAINLTIPDQTLRAELARKALARSYLHYGAFTSKYIGGEEWAKVPTNFLGMHVKEIMKTPGMKEAIKLIEESDDMGIQGAYYRELDDPEFSEDEDFMKAIIDHEKSKNGGTLPVATLNQLKKDSWVVKMKFRLIEDAIARQQTADKIGLRNIDDFNTPEGKLAIKLGLYELLQTDPELDKYNTPKMATKAILKKYGNIGTQAGLNSNAIDENDTTAYKGDKFAAEKNEQFRNLLYDTNKAFELVIRMHHMTGQSAVFDGPRWREGTVIPKGYEHAGKVAKKGQLILVNPIMYWEDPGDPDTGEKGGGKKVALNLRTAPFEAEQTGPDGKLTAHAQKIKRTLEAVRKDTVKENEAQRFIMSSKWTEAYQKLYSEQWEKIDFAKSAKSGRSARMANRLLNFPVILQHSNEVHAGKAKFLRRFAYLAVPSLIQMSGYRGMEELVGNWNDQFQIMKEGWVGRLAGAEKLKHQINRKEPDILNGTKPLNEFVKSLSEMKPTMKEYMTAPEVGSTVENWLRGLVEFRAKYSKEVDLLNLTREGLEDEINNAQFEGLIGDKKNEAIKRDFFGPKLLLSLDKYRFFNHEHFPGKTIWGLYGIYDSLKEAVKNGWWVQSIMEFIKSFAKQIVKG